jgi:Helicase associated domain
MSVEAAGVLCQEEVLEEEGVDTAAASTAVVEDEQQVLASQHNEDTQEQVQQVEGAAPFQQFYAIRRCYALKAPAVFLNYDDCSLYIEQDENDETVVEYKRFDIMAEAMDYIYEYITAPPTTRQFAATSGASTRTVATTAAAPTNKNSAGNSTAVTNNVALNALPESILAATKTTTSTQGPDDAANPVDTTQEGAGKMAHLQQNLEATTMAVDLSAGATTTTAASAAFPMMFSTTAVMPNGNNFQNMFYWTQPMPQFGFHQFPPMPPGWVPPPPVAMYQPSPVAAAKAPPKGKSKKKGSGPMETKGNSDTAESAGPKKRGRAKKKRADDDDDDDDDDEGSTLATSFPSKKKARKETKLVKMFEEKYELLKQYKEQYGTCDVPFNNKNTASGKFAGLGAWVSRMRLKMRASLDEPDAVTSLDKNKVQRLLDLGFAMSPHRWSKPHTISSKDEFNWDDMFDGLKAYKKQHGHVNVPHRPPTDGTEDEKKKMQDLRGWGT